MKTNSDKSIFLWEDLKNKLLRYIKEKKLAPGDSFFSADEISERYQVSNITSRRALQELAELGIIQRVKKKGSVITRGYQEEAEVYILIDLDEGKMILNNSYIMSEAYKGMCEESSKQAIRLKTIEPDKLLEKIEQENESGHLNVIILQELPKDKRLLDILRSNKANTICWHALEAHEGISTVRDDLEGAAYKAVYHLIAAGHRRIGMLSTDHGKRHFVRRIQGYMNALHEAEIDLDLQLIKESDQHNYADCRKELDEIMSSSNPPTAIFAATDFFALQIMKYCKEKKLNIPDDLSIIGIDNRPESELCAPQLSTVDLRWKEQGKAAVRLMRDMIDGKVKDIKDIKVEPHLIVRESSQN